MNNREIAGVKVFVSGETYDEYKGTLQEQIENLQSKIDKAIEWLDKNTDWKDFNCRELKFDENSKPEKLLDILKKEEIE